MDSKSNVLQRYSRELIAANNDSGAARDTALVWRGQVIESVGTVRATEDASDRLPTWLDRVMRKSA
ncbi:MAG: hypothetical protein AAGM16_10780 [Pseudomonadota bacterium]